MCSTAAPPADPASTGSNGKAASPSPPPTHRPPPEDETPDFDGGVRETEPAPAEPEKDHDELVRNLLAPRDLGVYP